MSREQGQEIARQLKGWVKRTGLSIHALSKKSKIAYETWARWTNGKGERMTGSMFKKFQRVLANDPEQYGGKNLPVRVSQQGLSIPAMPSLEEVERMAGLGTSQATPPVVLTFGNLEIAIRSRV